MKLCTYGVLEIIALETNLLRTSVVWRKYYVLKKIKNFVLHKDLKQKE